MSVASASAIWRLQRAVLRLMVLTALPRAPVNPQRQFDLSTSIHRTAAPRFVC
jgi:hypothetical protein